MKVLAFKNGKLVNIYEDFKEASIRLKKEVYAMQVLYLNGKQDKDGYAFDMAIDGIDYTGWGYEDARNRSL